MLDEKIDSTFMLNMKLMPGDSLVQRQESVCFYSVKKYPKSAHSTAKAHTFCLFHMYKHHYVK